MNRPESHPQPSSPSRCREVQDALACPPGRLDLDRVADHLADCDRCADLAEAAQRLALAWDSSRPAPTSVGFDGLWSQVIARADAAELAEAEPSVRFIDIRKRRTVRLVGLVLAQAAAVLIGWLIFREPGTAPEPRQTPPSTTGLLAMLGDVPEVINIEPSEVTILRVDHEGSLDRRDIDSLEISDTETVGFDTTVLGYFEGLGGS